MSKIAFLFPGQGAQHVGMGKSIAENYPAARTLYDRAAEILGFDLAELCFNGPADELDLTVNSQPALYVTSLAALEMLRADSPDVVLACEMTAGLSLGEYTALVFAGAVTFDDGLRLVQRRGAAMQEAADATPSGMISSLLLKTEQVEAVCEEARTAGRLEIANYLCPGNIVLSGDNAACERAVELIDEAGGKAVPLAVAGAFHTEIMQPADARLAEVLAGIPLKKPEIPTVSNVDARPHDDPDEIRELLVRQVVSPVLWEDSIRHMLDAGVDEFYEIGPGRVLRGLLKRINRKVPCTTINDS
ncbi:MAG: ACP S-malonyltransferase [Planctomycetaceae bacterium]|nr:ACP S-malonyltransferase [Planctomycetaceae bacterium]MBT6157095.1 ACP S-malonyltransferase [Planctomycetaceae bacterium]MBT6484339.1 ACP S-malonyltransferase [Planctomycetaceae bacterium]MBT6498072.1 ACP S-malonyltransferase [Planctomycetaceae bacterium]